MFPTLSGKITDKTKLSALAKVKVFVEGVRTSTLSRPDGFYAIQVPRGKYKVIYSLPGFTNFEFEVDLRNGRDFILNVELTTLTTTSETGSAGLTTPQVSTLISKKSKDNEVRPKIPKGMRPLEEPVRESEVKTRSSLSNSLIKEKSNIIAKKPILITRGEVRSLGKNIKLVGYNPTQDLSSSEEKTFSPRLINWVEPYDVSGFNKTLFYTEVNSGLKVGDRVFIINGNYDSNDLITTDKYKKGRDGYKVLFIDGCKIVLDIDYRGDLPWIEDPIDKFIKIYYIRNQSEFLQASRYVTTGSGVFDYKFSYNQNNIAFFDRTYTNSGKSWGRNLGNLSTGFHIKRGPNQTWLNISSSIINSGAFSSALSLTYPNNNRIKIMNGDFTYQNYTFREGYVYKWVIGVTQSEWVVDTKYMRPLISKSNFRSGNFDGIWNTGLFGTYLKRITWEGDKSTCNGGTIINTLWKQGSLNSKFIQSKSFFAGLNEFGLPYQKENRFNNDGRTFNYIIDSNIEKSNIIGCNIIDSIIGTSSATYSVVENHIMNWKTNWPNSTKNTYIENCDLLNSYFYNSQVKNIRSENSKFENVNSANSHFITSVFYNSNYSSDNIIKIIAYDEINASEYPQSSSTLSIGGSYEARDQSNVSKPAYQKVYKFYINETGYNRLKSGDEFYIRGIKINSPLTRSLNKQILNLFDKKFRLGTCTEYIDDFNSSFGTFYKRPIEITSFLSTPLENSYLYQSIKSSVNSKNFTAVYGENKNKYYSIDIWISLYDVNQQNSGLFPPITDLSNILNLNTSQPNPRRLETNTTGPDVISNVVDFTDAYIVDSDFDSGLFESSNWNSGSYVNSNNDLNITRFTIDGGSYNLSFTQSSSLIVNSLVNLAIGTEGEKNLTPGQIIFLDSVDFSDGVTTTRLPDTYKVISTNFNNGQYIIEEVVTSTSKLFGLSQSVGTFSTVGANNRWGYLKSVKFNKSKIKSGLFRRPYIVNSLIETESYDPLDRDYNNLQKARNLIITDLLSSNNSNYLSSATYLYSSFVKGSDRWVKGIVENSIWNGPTFTGGVIKQSTWLSGTFNGGYFYNSRSFNAVPTSNYRFYFNDRINTFWKSGTFPNNRFSWRDGIFLSGEFIKADWEGGTFSGGMFYSSKWYNGVFQNGVIGSDNISISDTLFYNGTINYATVNNASILAKDTSYAGLSGSLVTWNDGVFNNGLFSVSLTESKQSFATWSAGIFNGGEFTSTAKWKNGTFNGGKFLSHYGWTQSDYITQSYYGWEDGIFNGGEFGSGNGLTNSTWYTGEFNGGTFKGRVWNSGVFLYGEFEGSGSKAVGGATSGNANSFAVSYTNSYWGKWRNGYFTDTKDKLIKDKKTETVVLTSVQTDLNSRLRRTSKIKNVLWQGGTFSHPNATMENCVWLDGVFESGNFLRSSFNPYVKRRIIPPATVSYPEFNLNDDTCYWENGFLDDSEFYISKWKQGTFNVGTAVGMIFQNGVANYMNAYNVFWENGTWRNGNWNGSSWEYSGFIYEDYIRQILLRGVSWSGTSSCHFWNIFDDIISEPRTKTATALAPFYDSRLTRGNIFSGN